MRRASLVAVACFLPGRAKDLSAPPCVISLRQREGGRGGGVVAKNEYCSHRVHIYPGNSHRPY